MIKYGFNTEPIQVFGRFIFTERVVKVEILIVNKFCDTINFVLALVDDHLWVGHWDYIYFTCWQLILENRTFLQDNIDLELICRDMWLHKLNILLLCLHHGLKIYINFDAECLVICLTLTTFLFDIIHAFSSLLSINLQLFDFIEARRLFCKSRCLTIGIGGIVAVTTGVMVIIAMLSMASIVIICTISVVMMYRIALVASSSRGSSCIACTTILLHSMKFAKSIPSFYCSAKCW